MSRISWLQNFFGAEAGNAFDAITAWLAKHRTGTATEADRQELAANVKNLVAERVKAEEALNFRVSNPNDPEQARDMGLLQHIELANQKRASALQALTVLKGRHDGASEAEKPAIVAQAARMNSIIEACDRDLELDNQSLQSTQQYLQQTQEALDIARQELQSYETNLRAAKTESDRAERELAMAKANEERQRRLNGLKTVHAASSVALDAIRKNASEKRVAAKIANATAAEFAKTAPTNDQDEISKILGSAPAGAKADPFARLKPQGGAQAAA